MSFSFAGKTPAEIAALPLGVFESLTAAALARLTDAEAAALSAAQINAIKPSAFAGFAKKALRALTATALSSLSTTTVRRFSATQIGDLAPSAFAALPPADFAALTRAEMRGLDAAELNAIPTAALAALSKAQIAAIAKASVPGLSKNFLNGLDPSQINALTLNQIRALTAAQVAKLDSENFAKLNVADFAANQVGGLTSTEIGSLSKQAFDAGVAPYVADVSLEAVPGLTVAELESLTGAEAAAVSTKQYAALDASQQAALSSESAVMQDVAAQESNGTISYSGMLKVLEDAVAGGMNAMKFAALKQLDNDLEQGVIETTSYVAEITDDVIGGNSANGYWNGGAATAMPLDDMSAASSQAQCQELIGKWFLGTDLPSIDVPGVSMSARYQAENLPLFGSGGKPAYGDVSQGAIGDCYFIATLGETALLDPTLIENMIQENPNGTYSVEFSVNGEPDYVTVNNELSVMQGGVQWGDGSTLEFCNSRSGWGPLIEKAYAQLAEQAPADISSGEHEDAYAAIGSGGDNGISALTRQQTEFDWLSSSPSSLTSIADDITSALARGDDVLLASNATTTYGNLIYDHMFEVLGISGETVALLNPWNAANTDTGVSMQFTALLTNLAADQQEGFYIARGVKATS